MRASLSTEFGLLNLGRSVGPLARFCIQSHQRWRSARAGTVVSPGGENE
jgi:hypothetical protein